VDADADADAERRAAKGAPRAAHRDDISTDPGVATSGVSSQAAPPRAKPRPVVASSEASRRPMSDRPIKL
jgi:hypothetical protein